MRLFVLSDLHLEFEPYDLPENLDFDVAVFAGDTWKPVSRTIEWLAAQRNGALRGKPVVVVCGNHEFYGHEMTTARTDGRKRAAELDIYLLDPGVVVIGGVRFVGATLWTDFTLLGKQIAAQQHAQRRMNDYRRISILHNEKRRLLRPQDTVNLHRQDRAFIQATLAHQFIGPTVVVTHHAPHANSVAAEFLGDPLSPAFASNLNDMIMTYQPALWVHGHDHRHHDYLIGRTRIVANPAGYPLRNGRENENFDPRFTIEI